MGQAKSDRLVEGALKSASAQFVGREGVAEYARRRKLEYFGAARCFDDYVGCSLALLGANLQRAGTATVRQDVAGKPAANPA